MKLYHGRNVGVRTPELRPIVRALDFGRAFYLTTDPEQAMKWAHTTTKRRGEGAPYAFKTQKAITMLTYIGEDVA